MSPRNNQSVVDLWMLRLYVADLAQYSWIERNVRTVCDQYLAGLYQLEVREALRFRKEAEEDGVSAVPCLVRRAPLPSRNIVTDFANLKLIQLGLGLAEE